jgi:hypothetical protein
MFDCFYKKEELLSAFYAHQTNSNGISCNNDAVAGDGGSITGWPGRITVPSSAFRRPMWSAVLMVTSSITLLLALIFSPTARWVS